VGKRLQHCLQRRSRVGLLLNQPQKPFVVTDNPVPTGFRRRRTVKIILQGEVVDQACHPVALGIKNLEPLGQVMKHRSTRHLTRFGLWVKEGVNRASVIGGDSFGESQTAHARRSQQLHLHPQTPPYFDHARVKS
jgi:hypothetical protein